jgi:hypothetical protein
LCTTNSQSPFLAGCPGAPRRHIGRGQFVLRSYFL